MSTGITNRNMSKTGVLYFVVLALLQTRLSRCDIHIFVNPNGSDNNDGLSENAAVKTVYKAFGLAGNRHYNNETVYIELMQGYHDLDRTLHIYRSNTVMRSYKGQEVHLTGGRRIPTSYFKPVTDHDVLSRLPANARSHVRVVNLRELNITDFGKMEVYGSNVKRKSPLEVFYNGQALRLARWPNDGYLDVVDTPDGVHGRRFHYNSTVPQSWHNEKDPWAYGFWFAGWTDGAVKVSSLDAKTMTGTLATKPPHGIRKGHLHQYLPGKHLPDGGYFRFINIFSELDQPGEYYMDRDAGKLYMWVPNSNGNIKSTDTIYISMVTDCIWIQRSDVRLEDFTLEYCRKQGIFVPNVKNIKLRKLEIQNTGDMAIRFAGDIRDSEISQCYIHDTCGGILVSGGNRKTLQSSGNIIENNEIVRFSRVGVVGNDAVTLYGVGHIFRNNHIYNGQPGAINFAGNDIVMEHNRIHHVCLAGSSCNAIRTGYDLTFRGNRIYYNIIDNVVQFVPGGTNRAILLDGQASGTSIKYNVFINNTDHIYIAGGRYNEVINNVMYNATTADVHADTRGLNHNSDKRLLQRLHNMPFNNSLWSLKYPHLADIEHHNFSLPEGNQIVKNLVYIHPYRSAIFIGGIPSLLRANESTYFNISQTGFSAGSIDHYDITNRDLRVRCFAGTWANQVNFKQPPAPNTVGPLLTPVGPTYLNRGRVHLVNATVSSKPCATNPPPKVHPVASYLPDGSAGNHVYQVENTGCWLNVTRCKSHVKEIGTYRDMHGERYRHAADNETMCFRQALEKWEFCGSNANEWVVAIYGPTGSATLGGKGCMVATYGCPKHNSSSIGVIGNSIGKYQFVGQGKPGEEGCLVRARDFWHYCGTSPKYPITAIYLPTGAKRTAGGGCWITMERCPAHTDVQRIFYDADGASKYYTDEIEFSCHHRAEYYWKYCGSNPKYPVTATYRPTPASMTYP